MQIIFQCKSGKKNSFVVCYLYSRPNSDVCTKRVSVNFVFFLAYYEPVLMHVLDATYIGKEKIGHLYDYLFLTLILKLSELAENQW